MGFNLGNAFKYIWRADLKNDAIEDLEKAKWYIEDELKKRKASEHPGYQDNGVVKGAAMVPADEGWIPWAGARRAPVSGDVRVDVYSRNGKVNTGPAMSFTWGAIPEAPHAEIVAYRVIG
jgi:hypothetical protein